MLLKNLVAPVAVALSLAVNPVYASSWTVSATGIISSGFDFAGIFGTSQDLTGIPYTLTITSDPSLNADDSSDPPLISETSGGNSFGVYGSPSTITATVNGQSFTRTVDPNIRGILAGDGGYGMNNQSVWLLPPSYSSITSANYGYSQNATDRVAGDIHVSNDTNLFLSSSSFDQSLTYAIQVGDTSSSYWIYESVINGDYGSYSKFSGAITSISINPEVTVPIPAAIWLFGSCLVGLFGFARRKST